MREHKETLKSILKELVDKYGLDETIDYVAGIAEDIDFEKSVIHIRRSSLYLADKVIV